MSLPVKIRLHIGSGEIDGNGSAHRDRFASGKTGGSGVGLTPLPGVQIQLCLLVDLLALFVCAEHPGGVDECVSAEGQNRALIDCSSDGILYDIESRRCIHRDVLGTGAVCRQRLSKGRSLNRGKRLLSADWVLTCHGNRINVVVHNGLYTERSGIDGSVLANAGLCLCVYIGHGEGRTHADTLAGNAAQLIFDGQTIVSSGGGSGGVNLIGRLSIQLQNTGQIHHVLLVGSFQTGEDGLCIRLENRQGKAACHAHIGGTCAGDGGSTDAVSNIFHFAGIAVLGGQLGDGGFQKQIQTDGSQHLLLLQFPTNLSHGCGILQQGFYKEGGVTEQLCHIGNQALCQSHCPGGDCAQRIALQIGEHNLEDHIVQDVPLIAFQLLPLLLGDGILFAELFDVFLEKLILLFLSKAVPQGFASLLIQESIHKNLSAAVDTCQIVQELIENFVHAAAVCGFQHICTDNEVVSPDGLCAHIGLVLILHIVDCCCRAHADGTVTGGGIRQNNGIGVLKAGDTNIACGLNGHAVRDDGTGLVGMNIGRNGSCHLHAALGGDHAGALACKAGYPLRAHAAVLTGHAVDMTCRIAQRFGVILVDVLCSTVPVHGRGRRGIGRNLRVGFQQVIKFLDTCRGSFRVGHRRRVCACGTGVDILANTADGLCCHLHASGFHTAVELRHSGIIQNGKAHGCTYACPAAHCLRIGDELADSPGICGNNHITGHFGNDAIQLTHKRLGVHGADGQRHDRCNGDTSGGAGCGLDIKVCLIVGHCLQ